MMTEKRFEGWCGVVTGGSSGIGLATAKRFAAQGMRLALVGRREGLLEAAIEELAGDGHTAIVGDVGDSSFAWAMVDGVVRELGRLDVLVNNAGYAPLEPLGSVSLETVEQCFGVNAIGPMLMIERAIRAFRARGEGGCVVNVSTMGTADPFGGFLAYAASKAALNSMTRSIANECGESGVRSFTVAPGAVETPMLRGLFGEDVLPAEAALSPDSVAELIEACVAGGRDDDNGKVLFVSREGGEVAVRVADGWCGS